MSTERPTPRTDAAAWTETNWANAVVAADFARALERELAEAREELARLKAEPNNELRKTVLLRDYSEIIDHLQRCQDAEDEKLGDMGHDYFEQAITAIKDLQALVIDLTTHQPHPEPLSRPDGPGWWWMRATISDNWSVCYMEERSLFSWANEPDGRYEWLPATPPPAPKKEGES